MPQRMGKNSILLLAVLVLLLASTFPLSADPPEAKNASGRLGAPEAAQVVVHELRCDCDSDSGIEADVVLMTVGTEFEQDGQLAFHPIVSLAFDRLLGEDASGQWVALWNLGVSPAGWRRTLRAFFPIPGRAPKASKKKLAKLERQLEELREGEDAARQSPPEPYAVLSHLKHATASRGLRMGLKRVLNWLDVANPLQFLFRTFLLHRHDREERDFQRVYLGVSWLLDVKFDGSGNEWGWLANLNDLRYHLLRNRSFFGRWVRHVESLELVYHYDSQVRENLAKGSAWLQADANAYHLRYEPVFRNTANGTTVPVGGILYYDPRIAPSSDQARWATPNVFDLAYNPFTHPEIQRRTREHPEQLIPLALYALQSDLGLRPIIVVDFFAPNNPRLREASQQGMQWLHEWLVVATSFFSPQRFAYRFASYAVNKKAFTPLATKSARLGIEELRLALESHLYFDPAQRRDLLRAVDKRLLNPLVKPAEEEALLAELQYERLCAHNARAVCQTVNEVRRQLAEQFNVPASLPPARRWAELRTKLSDWRQRLCLHDLLQQGFDELGSLTSLTSPLNYFLHGHARDKQTAELLREVYAQLFRQQLYLPEGYSLEELTQALELAARAWARVEAARGQRQEQFAAERTRLEQKVRTEVVREERELEKQRIRFLRKFLDEGHEQLVQAAKAGCGQSRASPADVEMYLVILLELAEVLPQHPSLERKFRKQLQRLEHDLARLQYSLSQCSLTDKDPWRSEQRQYNLTLVRAAHTKISKNNAAVRAGGGD